MEISELSAIYQAGFKKYSSNLISLNPVPSYPHSIEAGYESLIDWSVFHSLDEVKAWFTQKRRNPTMSVVDIPLNETIGWNVDTDTGDISHKSNDFFIIHGIRVNSESREVQKGWDQPILEQVGFDGGLLGIVRKRFGGIPHYLCEAKSEPGNYGIVQISPTLQATFANLRRSHGGRRPHFAELFEDRYSRHDVSVLFDAWLAEDGGRLYRKRNRGILIEVDETNECSKPNDDFIWLSLYQIKALCREDSWINPHVRGVLCHV